MQPDYIVSSLIESLKEFDEFLVSRFNLRLISTSWSCLGVLISITENIYKQWSL